MKILTSKKARDPKIHLQQYQAWHQPQQLLRHQKEPPWRVDEGGFSANIVADFSYQVGSEISDWIMLKCEDERACSTKKQVAQQHVEGVSSDCKPYLRGNGISKGTFTEG